MIIVGDISRCVLRHSYESSISSYSMRWNLRRSLAIELDRQGRSCRRFERNRGSARFTRRPDRSMLAGPVNSPRPRPRPRSRRREEEEDALEKEMESAGWTEREAKKWNWKRNGENDRKLEEEKVDGRDEHEEQLFAVCFSVLLSSSFSIVLSHDLLTSRRPSPVFHPSRVRRFFVLHRRLPSASSTFAYLRHHCLNFSKLASSDHFSPYPNNNIFNAFTRSRLFEFAVLPIKSFVCRWRASRHSDRARHWGSLVPWDCHGERPLLTISLPLRTSPPTSAYIGISPMWTPL